MIGSHLATFNLKISIIFYIAASLNWFIILYYHFDTIVKFNSPMDWIWSLRYCELKLNWSRSNVNAVIYKSVYYRGCFFVGLESRLPACCNRNEPMRFVFTSYSVSNFANGLRTHECKSWQDFMLLVLTTHHFEWK